MSRLIDADAYEHAVQGNPYVSDSVKTYVRCSIQSQPTIDAEPVRHGKWIEGKCNRCGEHAPFWSMASTYYRSNYCPNCGARMDKDG